MIILLQYFLNESGANQNVNNLLVFLSCGNVSHLILLDKDFMFCRFCV